MNEVSLLNEIYYNDVNQQPPAANMYRSVKDIIDAHIAPKIISNSRDKRVAKEWIDIITKVANALQQTSQEMMIKFLKDVATAKMGPQEVMGLYQTIEDANQTKR